MRLIWSALWGAFPREIHLISEFLIPFLRAPALAPLAAPWEVSGVEGERQAQATGAGRGWGLLRPLSLHQAPCGPAAIPNCSKSGAWAVGQGPDCGGQAATPLPFPSPGRKAPGRGLGNPKMNRRIAKEAGVTRGSGHSL